MSFALINPFVNYLKSGYRPTGSNSMSDLNPNDSTCHCDPKVPTATRSSIINDGIAAIQQDIFSTWHLTAQELLSDLSLN